MFLLASEGLRVDQSFNWSLRKSSMPNTTKAGTLTACCFSRRPTICQPCKFKKPLNMSLKLHLSAWQCGQLLLCQVKNLHWSLWNHASLRPAICLEQVLISKLWQIEYCTQFMTIHLCLVDWKCDFVLCAEVLQIPGSWVERGDRRFTRPAVPGTRYAERCTFLLVKPVSRVLLLRIGTRDSA